MNKPYIYESRRNDEFVKNEAIIVLPDIYCQTDYSKRTVEEFADNFKKPVFLLDYFYLCTNKANNFNENNREKVHDIMENFKGGDFAKFFRKTLEEIKEVYPSIERFSVVGFCFGGRLSYIAGGYDIVSKVFSFYGSGANLENYIEGKTPIEYLVAKRNKSDLCVNSFFGINDPTFPETDRQKIKEELIKAGIFYEAHEYDAGHAYFQEGRKNYNASASQASWEVLKKTFN